jgi:hypothetical protein
MLAGDIQEGKEGDNERRVNEPTNFDYLRENLHCPSFFDVVADSQD